MAKYSYNGTILPALPNVGTTHPKMCIAIQSDGPFGMLYCFSNDVAFTYGGTDGNGYTIYIKATATSTRFEAFNAETATENYEEFTAPGELEQDVSTLHSDGLTPIWTNFDIIAEDGSVFLAASEPVLVEETKKFDLRSFLTGLALGLAGKPLPLASKEPIAYLYNGVRLPKLPESELPYVFIVRGGGSSNYYYRLFCTSKIGKYVGDPYSAYYGLVFDYDDVETKAIGYKPEGNGWVVFNTEYPINSGFSYTTNPLVWADHDVPHEDGSVYFAASEPIPVYE